MNNSTELKKKLMLYPFLGKTKSGKTIFKSLPKEDFSQVYSDFSAEEHMEAQALHEEAAHSMKKVLSNRSLGKSEMDMHREDHDQQILQMTLHLDEMIEK